MAKPDNIDAWMPLHIGKYVAATGHLALEEHGMYLLLLMHAWAAAGVIPGDPERIRLICRAEPKAWARSRDVILDFLIKQTDGTYRQKKLDKELAKALGLSEVRSAAGSKGAESRWQTDSKPDGKTNGNGHDTEVANSAAKACPIQIQQQESKPPLPPLHEGGAVDNRRSKPRARGNKPRGRGKWWLTPEGITAEGARRGIRANVGETMDAYAQRIREARAS